MIGLVLIFVQSDWGQRIITQKVRSTLEAQLHTKVHLRRIELNGFNRAGVYGLTIFDQQNKVLVHSDSLSVHIALMPLLSGNLVIHSIDWKKLVANVYTTSERQLNYQFIVDAFASPAATEPAPKDTSAGMQISLGRITLGKIRLLYKDDVSGMHTALRLDHLYLQIRESDLAGNRFDIGTLQVKGLTGFFDQGYRKTLAADTENSNASSPGLFIRGKMLHLEDIHFSYSDEGSGINTGWRVDTAQLQLVHVDLEKNSYRASQISLNGPVGYVINRVGLDTITVVPPDSSAPIDIQVKQIALSNAGFALQNLDKPRSSYKNAIDFNYLGLSGLQTRLADVHWANNELNGKITQLTARERSGFRLNRLSGDVYYGNERLELKNYYLATNRSHLSNYLELLLPTNADGSINTEKIGIHTRIPSSKLVLAEALYFAPELKEDTNFAKLWNKEIIINGQIRGTLSDLGLQQLVIRDNVGNDIRLSGRVRNVTDSKNLTADLNSIAITTGKSALDAWLPQNTLPPNIQLAKSIQLNGRLKGGMTGFLTDLNLQSSYGVAHVSGYLYDFAEPKRAKYDLVLKKLDMDIGKWITDTTIGVVRAHGHVKGRGLDPNTMNAVAELQIDQANAMGYAYQQISIQGQLQESAYTAVVKSLDSNLLASVDLRGTLQDSFPTVEGKIQLDRVDLYAIGLSTSPMLVKGLFDIDLLSTRPRALDGTIIIDHVQYANETDLIQLDSILLTAKAINDTQSIELNSPFGYAGIIGDYDYRALAGTVSSAINRQLNPTDSVKNSTDSLGRQVATIKASLLIPKALEKSLPSLELRKPVLIDGRINSDSNLVYLAVQQPQFRYGEAIVDSLKLIAFFSTDSVLVDLSVAGVDHPSIPIHKTGFSVNGHKGDLEWMLAVDDAAKKPSYRVGGSMELQSPSNWTLHMQPAILLNKEEFTASADNAVRFADGQLNDANLEISSGEQSISFLHNQSDTLSVPEYQLAIKNFQATTISSFVSKDTSLAEGLINANLHFAHGASDSSITGYLKVDSLRLFGKPVGNINADLAKQGQEIGVNVDLTGYGNNVKLEGTYGQELQANLRFDSLQMRSIEAFAGESVTNLSGAIAGNLQVRGAVSEPIVTGSLKFHKAKATVSYLNNPLLLDNQEIIFEEKLVRLNQFTLSDTAGGKAAIDGTITLEELQNPAFDLNVKADNFLVLGPKVNEEQMLWGPARINSTIDIGGNLTLPKVNLQLKLVDKSTVGFMIPDSEPGIANREGVIEFVNRRNPVDSGLIVRNGKQTITASELGGIEFSGDIEITPTSTMVIVIDPYNGDFLEIKGNTSLNVKVDQGNRVTLSGIYEISEGKYELSLSQLIKRSFDIEKGSTITWNGDPLEASVNISARNQVDAPAIDLIRDQSSGNRTEQNQLRQKVPVFVYLDITGELMEPTINFRLDMPERDRNAFNGAVYTRLKQINQNESELTKQVMSLLVLQTFMSENPLESLENRNSGGLGFTAKQSVSKILSQQLNTLAGSLIKGVDLNFDLETQEDYRSGSRREATVLNVGASKSLFNDRLTVSVGSNIGLLGETPANGAHLIGDVLIDYKLSRDGRYRLRAYQRNQTDAILLGQIIETGVSFIIVMDFNEFREIFQKAKQQQEGEKNEK